MTKFTKLSDLLGQEEKPKKPIEFTQFFAGNSIENPLAKPKEFENITYLGNDGYGDLFLAEMNKNDIAIYRGHLNDGFIEQ